MIVQCAWCLRFWLGVWTVDPSIMSKVQRWHGHEVSHGICSRCADAWMAEAGFDVEDEAA